MGFWDWVILIGSLLVVLFQGWWFSRKTKSNEDYFVGGRGMPWLAVGLSLFASAFSSLSFVGLPRAAAYEDYHLYLAILFIPLVVLPIVGWLFVPVYQRLRLTSAYEYLERRFNRKLRLAGSFLYLLYIIGWMGNILYATGIILQAALHLSPSQLTWLLIGLGFLTTVYTTAGGYKAVVYTEVVQALLLACTVVGILAMAITRIDGGFAEICRLGAEHGKFNMFDMRLDFSAKSGSFFAACAYGFVYLASNSTSQAAVQRYASMPGVAAVRWSLFVKGVATAVVCLFFFFLGTTLFAFYFQHPASDATASGNFIFPPVAKKDQLTTYFVQTQLPYEGLLGLLLAGLAAAMMSTMSGGLNSLSALVVSDWLPSRNVGVKTSRILTVLFGAGTIAAAMLAPYLGEHVFDILMKIAGAFFGPLFGLFVLGMLFPHHNSGGAMAGFVAGMITLAVVFSTDVASWWFGVFTFVPTLVVGWLVSFLFPAKRVEPGLTVFG